MGLRLLCVIVRVWRLLTVVLPFFVVLPSFGFYVCVGRVSVCARVCE